METTLSRSASVLLQELCRLRKKRAVIGQSFLQGELDGLVGLE